MTARPRPLRYRGIPKEFTALAAAAHGGVPLGAVGQAVKQGIDRVRVLWHTGHAHTYVGSDVYHYLLEAPSD